MGINGPEKPSAIQHEEQLVHENGAESAPNESHTTEEISYSDADNAALERVRENLKRTTETGMGGEQETNKESSVLSHEQHSELKKLLRDTDPSGYVLDVSAAAHEPEKAIKDALARANEMGTKHVDSAARISVGSFLGVTGVGVLTGTVVPALLVSMVSGTLMTGGTALYEKLKGHRHLKRAEKILGKKINLPRSR
jgi:hypothetical protein